MLQDRAVAYINADSAIEGNATSHSGDSEVAHLCNCSCLLPGVYTLRVDCTPSLHTAVYDLTKQVSASVSTDGPLMSYLVQKSAGGCCGHICVQSIGMFALSTSHSRTSVSHHVQRQSGWLFLFPLIFTRADKQSRRWRAGRFSLQQLAQKGQLDGRPRCTQVHTRTDINAVS